MRTAIRVLAFAGITIVPLAAFAQNATPPSRDARVRGTQSDVEITTGTERHNASANETLHAGQRVTTRANGSADLTLGPAVARLSENSALVVFAPMAAPAAGQQATDDTSLVRGQVAVSVGAQTEHPNASFTLATRAATMTFDAGDEAVVYADASGATRLAVQHGSVRVRASGREISVRQGSGVRVDLRRPPSAPRALPTPPAWDGRPPAAVLSHGEAVNVSATLSPIGRPADAARARYHVQVARDEGFGDRVFDQTMPATSNRVEARQLPPGRYFARVSRIDADRFESAFGPVVTINVGAPRLVPGGNGRRARVEVPTGFYCGLDGGPLTSNQTALWLLAARPHTVRCATTQDGRDATEMPIRTEDTGPLLHSVRIQPDDFDSLGGTRTIVVRLTDAGGLPLAYAEVRATVNEGAQIEPFREAEERGVYTATLRWRRGLAGLRMHFTVNGGLDFEEHRGVTHDTASSDEH